MSPRLLVLTVLLVSTSARAEVHLGAGGGFAAVGYNPCSYLDTQCEAPNTRALGAAPLLVGGVRHRGSSGLWRLRYGAQGSALFVPATSIGTHTRASVIGGAGEIGVERGAWSLDMVGGVARVALDDQMTHARSATMSYGYVLGLRVAPEWTVFARGDLHGVMHGDSAALFVGGGIAWSR